MKKPSLALVTGGTSGIGESLCRLLAKEEIDIIIVGRNEKMLHQLKNELQLQVHVETLAIDLSQKKDRDRLINCLHQLAPDLVVNNAGSGLYGEALSYHTEEQKNILEVNGNTVLEITLEAARTLISKGKEGIILNVSSAASFQTMPNFAVYAASKTFITHVSLALDEEMKPYGIRVLTTCPGFVQTHFNERAGGGQRSSVGMMSSDFVAQKMWQQIQSRKSLLIIDWKYRWLTYLSHLVPHQWIAPIIKKIINKRIPPRKMVKIDT